MTEDKIDSEGPLFESFFWILAHSQIDKAGANVSPIKPPRGTKSSVKPSLIARVLWHYPEDVSHIATEFRDIPHFCFPDLEKMKLESCHESKIEHFIFTLTDSKGNRMYGICLRGLFKGINKRFDISRRRRQCLCIISKRPFFSMFRVMLLQLHSLALLDKDTGSDNDAKSLKCWRFLESVYRQSLSINPERSLSILVQWDAHPDLLLMRTINLILPKQRGLALQRDVKLLPLFEVLGSDRFFKLLSAILCEQRIIFIADEVELLSSSVIAAASMLAPFQWQHIFIPLLPSKLLVYVTAPTPYLYGIRRYLSEPLKRQLAADMQQSQSQGKISQRNAQGVLIVDLDSGDMRTFGSVNIQDLVGDGNSALKQASEGLDRVKAAANSFLGLGLVGKSSESLSELPDQRERDRDLMAMIVADLKTNISSSKPGTAAASLQALQNSLQEKAGGVLMSLRGVAEGGLGLGVQSLPQQFQSLSPEEARLEWALSAEKSLREALTVFFVYLFAEIDDFVISNSNQTISNGGVKAISGAGGSRDMVDLNSFLKYRKERSSENKLLVDFLQEFIQSQMFERFCEERVQKKRRSSKVRTETLDPALLRRRSSTSSSSSSVGSDDDVNELSLYDASVAYLRAKGGPPTSSAVRTAVRATLEKSGYRDTANFHPSTLSYTDPTNPNPSSMSAWEQASESSATPRTLSGNDLDNSSPNSSVVERILQDSANSEQIPRIMRTLTFRLEACALTQSRSALANAGGLRSLSLLRFLLIGGSECVLSHALDFIPLLLRILRTSKEQKNNSNNNLPAMDLLLSAPFASSASGAASPSSSSMRPLAVSVLSLLVDHRQLSLQRLQRQQRAKEFRLHQQKSRVVQNGNLPTFEALRSQFGCSPSELDYPSVVLSLANKNVHKNRNESNTKQVLKIAAQISREEVAKSENGENYEEHLLLDLNDKPVEVVPSTAISLSPLLDLTNPEAKYRVFNQDTGEVMDIRDDERLRALSTSLSSPKKGVGLPRSTDPFFLSSHAVASAFGDPPPSGMNPSTVPVNGFTIRNENSFASSSFSSQPLASRNMHHFTATNKNRPPVPIVGTYNHNKTEKKKDIDPFADLVSFK